MGWEQAITTAVQSLYSVMGDFADTLFIFFTFLAEDTFLMIAVFAAYWGFSKRMGEYLMLSLFSAMALNGAVKDIVRRPRPFLTEGYDVRYLQIDNGLVNTVKLQHSYSFPSGHSQCAGGLWTSVALWFGRGWLWVIAAVAIIGVMTSRVYLGVHFPGDVIVGAVLGIASSVSCYYLFNRFYKHRIWLFVGVVALLTPMLLLEPSVDTVKTIGVGIGAVAGLFVEHRYISFSTDDHRVGLVLGRVVVGAVVVMTIRLGLGVIFPDTALFDGIRYAFVGVAATGLVPWIFVKTGLSKKS